MVSRKIQKLGFVKDLFSLNLTYGGPRGQLLFIMRLPITYKNSQMLSKNVSFTSYLDWMGEIRECSLYPISKEILDLTKTGKWGLATNKISLNIYDVIRPDDLIEIRMWMEKATGFDNIYHLEFDWLKVCNQNRYKRVASSKVITSFVEVIGHGKARFAKPPKFLKKFIDEMKPRVKKRKEIEVFGQLWDKDESLGNKKNNFLKNAPLVYKNKYQSTMNNSNLIGNVYFSNYAKWINSSKDLFFYNLDPDFFRINNFVGEFVPLKYETFHLNEAMPFDDIIIKTYIINIFQKGLDLKFEVFKKVDESLVLLANATQKLAYVAYIKRKPIITHIPRKILKRLACITQQSFVGVK